MGLRFRKSIKLGKHTRLNLNKKSFGVSFGGKGARFTLNSKGRRTSTFGIPGTGLSYTTASGGKKKSRSKSKAKGRKVCGSSTGAAKPSGCLIVAACIGIIFIMICLVMAVVIGKNKNGSSVTLEWTQSDISVNSKAYIPNLYLKVDGKKANEISPPEIQISNNDICKIEYKDSNYAQVIYEIIPLKDGFADITATYDGVTSEPVTITVDMGEKVETATATTTETETEPPETTTETTTTAKQQEIVYITPTGDKYHTKSCRYYSDSCMAMTKEQAIQAGYTACDVCH